MKVADNQYLYRLETQTENGSTLDYQEIETVEPLRSVGDIHDEIDLENNKQIKRIEEICKEKQGIKSFGKATLPNIIRFAYT